MFSCIIESMKALLLFITLCSTSFCYACDFSIIEQDGRYYLALKRIGELPSKDQKVKEKLRIGLQEVTVVSKEDDKQSKNHDARLRIYYSSEKREEVERMLKLRCSK